MFKLPMLAAGLLAACGSLVVPRPPPPVSARIATTTTVTEPARVEADTDVAATGPSLRPQAAVEAFVRVQRQLAPFGTPDMSVPAGARPLLKELKRVGAAAVGARLQELLEQGRGVTSEDVFEAFRAGGAISEFGAQPFGTLDGTDARAVAGHEGLYAVVLSVGLVCGSDGSLLLYRWDGARLTHVLTAASHDYPNIDGGQLALQYAVSPPAAGGDFYVVTAHSTPWCSSVWRGIDYRVYEPTGNPEEPRQVLRRTSDAWLGGDTFAKLAARADGFEVEFLSWDRLGASVVRTHLHAFPYARHASRFERAAPWVRGPEELPDEWLTLDWPQAKRLVVPKRGQKLAAVHARWKAGAKTERGAVTMESQASGRAIVRFECPECTRLPARARFVLEKRGGTWLVADVRES